MCACVCVCGLTPVTRAHTFSAHTDKRKRPEPFDDNVHTDTQLWCGSDEVSVLRMPGWQVLVVANHIAVSYIPICDFECQSKKEHPTHQKLKYECFTVYCQKTTA